MVRVWRPGAVVSLNTLPNDASTSGAYQSPASSPATREAEGNRHVDTGGHRRVSKPEELSAVLGRLVAQAIERQPRQIQVGGEQRDLRRLAPFRIAREQCLDLRPHLPESVLRAAALDARGEALIGGSVRVPVHVEGEARGHAAIGHDDAAGGVQAGPGEHVDEEVLEPGPRVVPPQELAPVLLEQVPTRSRGCEGEGPEWWARSEEDTARSPREAEPERRRVCAPAHEGKQTSAHSTRPPRIHAGKPRGRRARRVPGARHSPRECGAAVMAPAMNAVASFSSSPRWDRTRARRPGRIWVSARVKLVDMLQLKRGGRPIRHPGAP